MLRVGDRHRKKRIAIGSGMHDRLRGDVAARSWPVFDDDLLVEPLRQRLSDQACDNISRARGRKPTMMRTGRVG
jgi:hypothetical protein